MKWQTAGTEGVLSAEVELAELMGAENNLYLDCVGNKLIARMPSSVRLRNILFTRWLVKLDKIHVFGQRDGKGNLPLTDFMQLLINNSIHLNITLHGSSQSSDS